MNIGKVRSDRGANVIVPVSSLSSYAKLRYGHDLQSSIFQLLHTFNHIYKYKAPPSLHEVSYEASCQNRSWLSLHDVDPKPHLLME